MNGRLGFVASTLLVVGAGAVARELMRERTAGDQTLLLSVTMAPGDHPAELVQAPGSESPLVVREPAGVSAGVQADPVPHTSAASVARGGAADWTNLGGNAQRSGQSPGNGPLDDVLLWTNDDVYSIIAWHPVVVGDRVFVIRETGFPGAAANDLLVALDLDTGVELWRKVVPYGGNPNVEWIAHVVGAWGDRVYAARGGSNRQTPVHAFDAATGELVWSSDHLTYASPQENAVFTPEGDLIVGDFLQLARIAASDGSTVWSVARQCAVSGNCAAALGLDGVYIDQPVPGPSQVISKFDVATGAFRYNSPSMIGMTVQNAPFVSPDGTTVYLARSQNNASTDFLYAFTDTGAALVSLWDRPIRWTTSHEHGIAADGSIYTFLPGDEFVRLHPATGDVTATAGVLAPVDLGLSPRTAVAADGTVYVSNGWAGTPATNGRIWAFKADLSANHFTLQLDRQNSGGPSIGSRGTLVVADRVSVRAYRTQPVPRPGDLNCDGHVDFGDINPFVLILSNYPAWQAEFPGCPPANGDIDGDGGVNFGDINPFVALLTGL